MTTTTPPTDMLTAYRRLLDISRDLAATLDLDALLNRIVHAAADLSNAEAASILLYDPQRKELRFQAATNLSDSLKKGVCVPLDNSIAGLALRQRRPIRRDRVYDDPNHYGHLDKLTKVQTQSLLAVPLIAQGQPIGVLEAVNKREGPFTDTDEELLTVLGAQAAVAIQNTRLFLQSDLIAELVHEIRTPLGAILAAAQLLRLPQLSLEQREQTISAIETEARYLNELTTTYLDLARLESGRAQFERTEFDLRELAEEVVQLFAMKAKERNIQIEVDFPEDFPKVHADRNKIKQVMVNLVSNAVKYNRPGGRIRIAGYANEGEVVFTVSDTGPGIAPEHMKHLFEKFYRVPGSEKRAMGSGLGLYLCRRIIEAHGGSIRAKSKVGEGSTFIVTLPLH
ncbi:MAG: GAF domain-containing protein [Chloroflexi bacterium]|nr:GAF domain-containing protein [Chloroflexota bacterium]